MPNDTACPSPEALEDLLANRLPHALAEELRGHLSMCSRCKARSRVPRFPFLEPPAEAGELGRLGPFRIRGLLGEGGMGVVFDAEDENLHRPVALKVLRPDKAAQEMRQRFLTEARLLAQIDNPNVVHIYQVGEAGLPFMAMERLRGETLEQRLRREGSIPAAEALSITRHVAEGLAAVHGMHLVHRDIKPANIWLELSDSGRLERVVLLDFGIARRMMDRPGLPGTIVGTPSYMSPEQALGGEVDERSDLYGLGCVLYRMVTGRPPFAGENEETELVLQAAIAGEPPPVAGVVPSLPAPIARLIHDLMCRDPAGRPVSARDLIARLDALGDGPASPTSAAQPRPPWHAGIFVGAAVLILAVTAAAIGFWRSWGGWSENGKPSGEPIVVGVLHSLTGPLSLHERPIVHATHLAIEEINESGGVLGRPVRAVTADGASDEDVFADRARWLIQEKKASALFGCWASAARKKVGNACVEEGKLLFYPTRYEGLGDKPSVAYLGGSPNQTMIPLIRWAYSDLKRRRFFLLGSENVDSYADNATVRHEIEALRGEVVGERYVLVGETAMDAVADEVKRSKADFIFNTLDGQSNIAFLKALRSRGMRPPEVVTAWCSISESELGLFRAEELVGDYTVANYFESLGTSVNREFVSRFHARFPGERVSDAMQTAYVGVYLWKKAVEKAGTPEASAVRQALKGLSVDGPEGPLRLSDDYHAWRTARVGRIVANEGKPDFLEVYRTPGPIPPEPFPSWRTREQWQGFLDGLSRKWGGRWEKHK
jgi:urea transport system substrate-binding protein